MDAFDSLQLPPPVRKAVARLGFVEPTPVQREAIPVGLSGRDLIGCAQTGTGKTAAFCIPILVRLLRDPSGLALVLVPTRELARQIDDFWKELCREQGAMTSVVLIGGAGMPGQIRALARRPRMVVATPGRLLDHLNRRTIDLRGTAILVLDEADRMLDMGFEPQLTRIAKHIPRERQTLLFSATMPPEAENLSARFVRNAVRVTVGKVSRACEQVTQSILMTEAPRKNDALLDQINRWPEDSILVFTRTKSRTDRVARYLSSFGLPVARLHGGRTQGQRNAALGDFKNGRVRILVATDIAARGIDVKDVGFVINYDLPQVAEDYVHRIGRTGRAGAVGEAVSLITHEDRAQWREIVALLKKTGSRVPAATQAAAEKKEKGVAVTFLERVLEPPTYGFEREGRLYVPSHREIVREFWSRLNVFRSRKNWLALFGWATTLSFAIPLAVFLTHFFSLKLMLAGFVYSMVLMGSHGTFWFHRYGTHRAFKFRNQFWAQVGRNLVIKAVPEETYIVSHYVHHHLSEQPGDPYNVHAGFLYCFLADVNHQAIRRDLSEKDYDHLCRLLNHTGVRFNSYAQYQRWGSLCHPGYTILHYALNWAFWFAFLYLLGGFALATAIFGWAGVWAVGIRTFNYEGHGKGVDRRREGVDFNRADLSVNQTWPGFVAGEWHNNHHLFPNGARSGFLTSQIDLPWYLIRTFSALGIVSSYRDFREDFMRDHYRPWSEARMRAQAVPAKVETQLPIKA